MKKLILSFLILCISTYCFSQNKKLLIDNEIEPYIEQFVAEALDRGFYARFYLIENIDHIRFHNGLIGTSVMGTVSADMRSIYLNPITLSDTLLLRTTIYHEIGHIIKKSGEHTCFNCYDIMSEHAPISNDVYRDDEFWALRLDDYFKWLSEK